MTIPGNLVLSTFPGIDILGRAFEDEGYCVVKTGDPIFGQRGIESFHPTPRAFAGIVGGPPCQAHSRARHVSAGFRKNPPIDLVPEFMRVINEGQPNWWLMENTPDVPDVAAMGYEVHRFHYDARWLGSAQHRRRKFQFGSRTGAQLIMPETIFHDPEWERTVLAVEGRRGQRGQGLRGPYIARRTLERICELQGIDVPDIDRLATTTAGIYELIGNAVHYEVARALAHAVTIATTELIAPRGMWMDEVIEWPADAAKLDAILKRTPGVIHTRSTELGESYGGETEIPTGPSD